MKEAIRFIRNNILKVTKLRLNGESPRLVIIQVGNDPASDVYVRNKIKTCESVGIKCQVYHSDYTYAQLRYLLISNGSNSAVNGIILQLPLPDDLKKHEQELIDLIPWYKDVDGLSTESIGRLWTGQECLKPATALGVKFLANSLMKLKGKTISIINRSALIGKPLAKMLLDEDATVQILHSKSDELDLEYAMQCSDIVITGIGSTELTQYYKEPTIWIDCGIIRKEDGKICGDAGDLKSQYITPVPCGVGTLTTACIAFNCMCAYKIQGGMKRWDF